MSLQHHKIAVGRAALLLGGYVVIYLAASALDLWTTDWALHRPGTFEGNVFATTAGSYQSAKAWLITAVGGVVMASYFGFGVWNADRVSPKWFRRPIRSFFHRGFNPFYLNPWSKRLLDRTPLHAVSFAVAFVALRLLAAGNNLSIAVGGEGPLGAAVQAVARVTSPAVGLLVAMGALYTALAIALSPLSADLLQRALGTLSEPA